MAVFFSLHGLHRHFLKVSRTAHQACMKCFNPAQKQEREPRSYELSIFLGGYRLLGTNDTPKTSKDIFTPHNRHLRILITDQAHGALMFSRTEKLFSNDLSRTLQDYRL